MEVLDISRKCGKNEINGVECNDVMFQFLAMEPEQQLTAGSVDRCFILKCVHSVFLSSLMWMRTCQEARVTFLDMTNTFQ